MNRSDAKKLKAGDKLAIKTIFLGTNGHRTQEVILRNPAAVVWLKDIWLETPKPIPYDQIELVPESNPVQDGAAV